MTIRLIILKVTELGKVLYIGITDIDWGWNDSKGPPMF